MNNQIVYQIFVRNYSKEGSFLMVQKDLERIKDLGVDIVYFMPIHKIGIKNRKGTYGSPYAIKDYYSITPDYGTIEDFKSLVNKIHDLNMKIILDMVFNHTTPDNVLVDTHPEYYFYRDGKRGNRVGDWSDIVDLDHSRDDVQHYLLDVLKYWVNLGVDGFRFDVANLIPLSFFKMARKELGKDVIFIAESIEKSFHDYLKTVGIIATKDEDLFPTFDSAYNYSWYHDLEAYLKKEKTLQKLVDALNEDETLLYQVGSRLNCFENHDLERIAHYLNNDNLKEIIRLFAYLKGNVFIYMGQEYGISHKPELFEKDPVIWTKNDEIYRAYKDAIMLKKKLNLSLLDKYYFDVEENKLKLTIKRTNGEVLTELFNI